MEEAIKVIRLRIDSLAQLTGGLANPNLSRQLQKSVDALFLSKAWLGKMLGELNVDSPYQNEGNRKTVDDIEPTADRVKEVNISAEFSNGTQIEKIDFLRQQIGDTCQAVFSLKEGDAMLSFKNNIFSTSSYTALCEARFELGFELERIRENA